MPNIIDVLKKMFGSDSKPGISNEILAEDCMISRSNIIEIYLDNSPDQIYEIITENQQKFFIVCKESLDDIVGILNIFKIGVDYKINIQDLEIPVFISDNTNILDIIEEVLLQKTIYVVVDEFGGTKGIVNSDSIINYMLNISEDRVLEKNSTIIINGNMFLEHFQRIVKLPESIDIENFDSKTVNGFIIEFLGHIPKLNEVFFIPNEDGKEGGIDFKILEIKDRHINKVSVTKK